MLLSLSLVSLAIGQTPGNVVAHQTLVDCDGAQSLNRALTKLDKETPTTVLVKGTCTEYVLISGWCRSASVPAPFTSIAFTS
jgi:hypothetical protein